MNRSPEAAWRARRRGIRSRDRKSRPKKIDDLNSVSTDTSDDPTTDGSSADDHGASSGFYVTNRIDLRDKLCRLTHKDRNKAKLISKKKRLLREIKMN